METEKIIYRAAKSIFLNYGYRGSTMEQIAESAGLSRSVVHYYYRTKQALFDQVFQEFALRFLRETSSRDLLPETSDQEDRVELHEIAWFLAQELRTNPDSLERLLETQERARAGFSQTCRNPHWVDAFRKLVDKHLREKLRLLPLFLE